MQWEKHQLKGWKKLEADVENKHNKHSNDGGEKKRQNIKRWKRKTTKEKSYVFRGVEAKWQPVQSLTRLVLLLVRIRTGIPSNWGSTGWRKGRDSGSCRYKASRVGIRAWRSSSGLKTGKDGSEKYKMRNEKSFRDGRSMRGKTTQRSTLHKRALLHLRCWNSTDHASWRPLSDGHRTERSSGVSLTKAFLYILSAARFTSPPAFCPVTILNQSSSKRGH